MGEQKQWACGLNISVILVCGSIGITWQFYFHYRDIPWLSIQELPTAIQMAWLRGTCIPCWICSWMMVWAWNHHCHLSSEADAIGIAHRSSFSRLELPPHSICCGCRLLKAAHSCLFLWAPAFSQWESPYPQKPGRLWRPSREGGP